MTAALQAHIIHMWVYPYLIKTMRADAIYVWEKKPELKVILSILKRITVSMLAWR